jgi:hypothetical protein
VQTRRQSQDIHVHSVDSDSGVEDVYAGEAMHDCNILMNDNIQAELGTMYIETAEDIAIEKAMWEEWDY